jgi:REP element-mobilizing transposase RayT
VADGRYFVTIHTAGAIPVAGQRRIREISESLQKAEVASQQKWLVKSRLIFQEMERWLDAAKKADHFREPEIAKIVVNSIEHRTTSGVWRVFEYVVMPNHVHMFFELLQGRLKPAIIGFKRWTGREAAKLATLDADTFWQREWFDHWSRSDEEDDRIAAYIRRNPVTAGLVRDYREWPYGSW